MSDALSLTLPKATARPRTKRRKRWRPPRLFVALFAMSVAFCVADLITGRPVHGVLWFFQIAQNWRGMQRRPLYPFPLMLMMCGVFMATDAAGIA